MIKTAGTSFRPEEEIKLMYGYPQKIRKLATEKPTSWEYYLLMGTFIVQYEWLEKARHQKEILWWNESAPEIASNIEQITKFCNTKTNELISLLDEVKDVLSSNRLNEAIGEPGYPGNVEKIFVLAEGVADCFKKIMIWKHQFQYINVPFRFREIIEVLISLGDGLLCAFDDLYTQSNESIKSLDDYYSGKIDADKINLTLNINIDCDTSMLYKAIANSFNRN